jgi:hypothetical protein
MSEYDVSKMTKNQGFNWNSKEKIDDIIPKEIPEFKSGVSLEDTHYSEEMYSDEQLKRHDNSNMNAYTVDGIPSRWYHNKLRSKWHFDTKADPNEETFKIMCKFKGDWSKGIAKALNDSKEQTIGNYRPRSESKQDKDLNDGELLDIQRASRQDDISCMYNDTLITLVGFDKEGKEDWRYNKHEDYEVFYRMADALGIIVHQMRVHVQLLGQVTPFHIDQQMRYARPHWRDIWKAAGADKDPLKLRRVLIALNDWDYGHVWQFGNTYYHQYDAGECIVYDWCNMPHGTANFGYTPRFTLQITGFVTEKTEELIRNGSKQTVIEV